MTNEQFEELLALEHEIPGVEFKGPGPRGDDYLRAKVARAVMGMTNRRDGGVVIIGVEERGSTLNHVGLQTYADSWRNNDHVSTALANYMSPPPSFDLSIREFQGREFAALEVHEFADIPIICKKGYYRNHQSGHREVILREGACYIRSRHKPETVEISSLEHMRELLDLATEKGVRKFVTQAQKAGMSLLGSNQPHNDSELFDKQANERTSSHLEKISSRGNWKVIIRPDRFSQDKIEYNLLHPLVENTAVSIYDERFPNIVQEYPLLRGADYIGQEIAMGHFLEAWYLYQSGQFIDYLGMLDDWLDQSDWFRISPGWEPGKRLSIEEVVRHFTCIFVFASRLALTDVYADDTNLYIDVLLKGLQGRRLYIDTPGKVRLRRPYDAQISEFHYAKRFQRDELIANSKELALSATRELFLRFGWDVAQANLESVQSTLNLG
jgi:hypothetical protein